MNDIQPLTPENVNRTANTIHNYLQRRFGNASLAVLLHSLVLVVARYGQPVGAETLHGLLDAYMEGLATTGDSAVTETVETTTNE